MGQLRRLCYILGFRKVLTMANGFRYEFTGNELSYFLLKKKACPQCGGKMSKNKCAETVDGSIYNTASVPLYIRGREVKRYFYSFSCTNCGAEYTLSELAK